MTKLFLVMLAALSALAAVITVGEFAFGLWDFIGPEGRAPQQDTVGRTTVENPHVPTIATTRAPNMLPTNTPQPTRAFSLNEMMIAAETGTTDSGQNLGMRRVSEIALNSGDYETAIKAGKRSATSLGRAETLSNVARHAIKHHEYAYALEAAVAITIDSHLNKVRLEVLSAIREAQSSSLTSAGSRTSLQAGNFPSIFQMLAKARYGGTSIGQGMALRKVAEIAVILERYADAIEAGSSTRVEDLASATLTYVSRCAVAAAEFEYGLLAASAIPSTYRSSLMKVEVLSAVKVATMKRSTWFTDPISPPCR